LDSLSINLDGCNVNIESVGDITTAEIITNSGEFFVVSEGEQGNGGSGNAGQINIDSSYLSGYL
ncbi:MAG: hypothetical protein F6K17_25105, partial [Okeania sp. SIO3C4]|nr:hypothetical protein [Okeania sp. SIO3C4]